MDRFEWISVHFGLIQSRQSLVSNQTTWVYELRRHRAKLTRNAGAGRDSRFTVGHLNSVSAAGPIITNADQSFEVATVRVWLEPPISNASQAAGFADSLMNMDTRRPGGEFDVTTGVGQLSVAIGEPKATSHSTATIHWCRDGSGQLVASEWQPLFGQPIVYGAASARSTWVETRIRMSSYIGAAHRPASKFTFSTPAMSGVSVRSTHQTHTRCWRNRSTSRMV